MMTETMFTGNEVLFFVVVTAISVATAVYLKMVKVK